MLVSKLEYSLYTATKTKLDYFADFGFIERLLVYQIFRENVVYWFAVTKCHENLGLQTTQARTMYASKTLKFIIDCFIT